MSKMVCALQFGPHGNEHYKYGSEFVPPKRVLVQSGDLKVSVYKFVSMSGASAKFVYDGQLEPKTIDGLVEFVERQ